MSTLNSIPKGLTDKSQSSLFTTVPCRNALQYS